MKNRKMTVFAACAVAAATLAPTVHAQQIASVSAVKAGVSAAVRGEVKLVSFRTPKKVGIKIGSGHPIYLGDEIQSGPEAGLQIMLADETIFTIGADSAIVIDKFVYDPSKSAGKVSATVLRGVFRFVSGRVAANKPSDMEVKLPNGTIGIRGTSAGGFVRNGVSEVVLLGPGPENNVGEPGGRIIVSGEAANTGVHITRVNFGTRIAGAAAPTAPIRWDGAKMNSLTGALRTNRPQPSQQPGQAAPGGNNPQQGDGQQQDAQNDAGAQPQPQSAGLGGDGNVTAQAGQDVGAAVGASGLLGNLAERQNGLNGQVGDQIAALKNTLSGITTVNQLTQITSGSFNYGTTNNAMQFSGSLANSTYDFAYSIDFAARSHTGSVTINTNSGDAGFVTGSGTFSLLHDPFTNADPNLDITEGGPTTHVPGLNANDNRITVQYKFVNDGAIATRIEHSVTYAEPQGTPTRTLTGSGSNDRPK